MSDATDLDLAEREQRWLASIGGPGALPGCPSPALVDDRRRAFALVMRLIPDVADRLRPAALGPVWWRDIDVVGTMPEQLADSEELLPLAGLHRRLRRPAGHEFALVDGDRVVGRLDFDPGQVADGPERLERRVARTLQADGRDVLELRALFDALGEGRLPAPGSPWLAEVAELEQRLVEQAPAGTVAELGRYRRQDPIMAARRFGWRLRRRWRRSRRWSRRPYRIALSGVDGAGKSTTARMLAESFERVGLDAAVVWSRPGNRMEWANRLLRVVGMKRSGSAPGVAQVAQGLDGRALRSRRGVVGLVWVLVVSTVFVFDVWSQDFRRRQAAILIYDRHLMDAIVSLDFIYAGTRLGPARWLCRRLPRADTTFYLDVDSDEAVSRKPGDVFGSHAVSRQLEGYRSFLDRRPDVVVVEPGPTPQATVLAILERLSA